MLRSAARLGGLGALGIAFALLAVPASGAPLGLSPGDEVQSIEWDALKSNPGDGGTWTIPPGIFHADGRINSVTVAGPTNIGQSGVDLQFDLDLLFSDLNTAASPIVSANTVLVGSTSVTHQFLIQEGGLNILFGNVVGVQITGNINLVDTSPQTLTGVGVLTILGGATNLVNALGGTGGTANLFLTAQVFSFDPSLASLGSDGNVWNSNFNVSLSGTLIPLSNAPFVPEPSTAALLATGMLGLLGLTRRAGRRRP